MIIDDFRTPFPNEGDVRWWEPLESYGIDGARSWWRQTAVVAEGYRDIQIDIHVPANYAHPVPVVVWVHGGAWTAGNQWRMPLKWPQLIVFRSLIAHGLAVASVDYRLLAEAPFPACVHDVRAVIRYVKRYADAYGIDPNHVGLWGESAGGQLAGLVGLLGTTSHCGDVDLLGDIGVPAGDSTVGAVVDWYGPVHMDSLIFDACPQWFGDSREVARAVSPITHVRSDAPPFLLMHGLDDHMVPHAESQSLHEALISVGADSTYIEVAGADHNFAPFDAQPFMDRACEFLKDHLA